MSERLEHLEGEEPWVPLLNGLADLFNAMTERVENLEAAVANLIQHIEAVSEVVARHHGDELLGQMRLVEQPETPIGPFLVCPVCGETHDMHTASALPARARRRVT
jgi:hypothetical protein